MAHYRSAIQRWADPKVDTCLTERDEQVLFVRAFETRWPDDLIFAVPNGGKRAKLTAANLQAEGVKPGVPDLFVPTRNLWVEMKRVHGGRLSPAQKEMISRLEAAGHQVIVGHGAADALRQVEAILSAGAAA